MRKIYVVVIVVIVIVVCVRLLFVRLWLLFVDLRALRRKAITPARTPTMTPRSSLVAPFPSPLETSASTSTGFKPAPAPAAAAGRTTPANYTNTDGVCTCT
jgi:hypothetical protein